MLRVVHLKSVVTLVGRWNCLWMASSHWHPSSKCSWSASTTNMAYPLDAIFVEVRHLKLVCVSQIDLHYSEFGERIPPPVIHPSEQLRRPFLRTGPPRPLKRSFAMLGMFSQTLPTSPELSHFIWKILKQGPLQRTRTVCLHIALGRRLWRSYWSNWMPVSNLVLQTLSSWRSFVGVNVGWSLHKELSMTTPAL